ncbi:biotin synthase BioB [Candidatus Deianiraea vastatrix]|uniref:Biotin synthase n=1 Tax=Candidatus Deianiraea vastatrix TaxID=2163644 RepID=A0A5B8XES0_9RICK|nr:biotin synthase BioB [Candidatus Deianiraea vastatrix]QED23385.1 Biotin synthase [Candidatus Deianiraea vastatrix]
MTTVLRNDWKVSEVLDFFQMPFNDLIFKSHSIHRENFNPNTIQISTLLSIKTGGCPENCSYCPQSAHHNTNLEKQQLMNVDEIVNEAKSAKDAGASRFCMGAAWRNLHDRDLEYICEIIRRVKSLGLETCMTLGMLKDGQAEKMKEAGLDFYNHNIDTSEEFYDKIITTRKFEDRIDTIEKVRNSGLNVCCGGIVGMGEDIEDRAKMLITLANFEKHPESVPINQLVKVDGTPLQNEKDIDGFDFIKTIAVARIMMPKSYVRLSAGRTKMNEQMQALCFFAGANSIFFGEKLLTTENPEELSDLALMKKLGISGI